MAVVIFEETRTIAAAPETVWDTIADFPAYPDWNPWLTSAHGGLVPGDAVTVTACFKGQGGTYRHRMVAAERPTLFHWCDVGWFTLFAKGERIRTLTPINAQQCHYRVALRITGPGAGLAKRFYGAFMRGGLAAEADALKQRCEAQAQATTHKGTPSGI